MPSLEPYAHLPRGLGVELWPCPWCGKTGTWRRPNLLMGGKVLVAHDGCTMTDWLLTIAPEGA